MRTPDLLDELRRRGIVVKADGGGLLVDAPKGAVDDALLTEIRRHKRELIQVETLKCQWLEARRCFWEAADDEETEWAWVEYLAVGDWLWGAMGAEAYAAWADTQRKDEAE